MQRQSATSIHMRDTHDSMWDNKWVGVDLPKLVIGKERGVGAVRGTSNGFNVSYINQSAAYRITLVRIISANARSFSGAISDRVGPLGRTHHWRRASTTFCATPATFLILFMDGELLLFFVFRAFHIPNVSEHPRRTKAHQLAQEPI